MDTVVANTQVKPTAEAFIVSGMIPSKTDVGRMIKELEDIFRDLALQRRGFEAWVVRKKVSFDPTYSPQAIASIVLHAAYLATGEEEDRKEGRTVTIGSPKIPPSLVTIEIRVL